MKLNEVVTEKMGPEGVQQITAGAVMCAQVRSGLRAVLKQHDPEGYALYRSIKYPTGEGSATPETGMAATKFLFDQVRDLLVPHYVSTKDKPGEAFSPAAEDDQDENDDQDESDDDDQDDDEG